MLLCCKILCYRGNVPALVKTGFTSKWCKLTNACMLLQVETKIPFFLSFVAPDLFFFWLTHCLVGNNEGRPRCFKVQSEITKVTQVYFAINGLAVGLQSVMLDQGIAVIFYCVSWRNSHRCYCYVLKMVGLSSLLRFLSPLDCSSSTTTMSVRGNFENWMWPIESWISSEDQM